MAPAGVSAATLQYLLTTDAGSFERSRNQVSGTMTTLFAGRITAESLHDALDQLRSIADQLAVSQVAADTVYELVAGYLRPNQVEDVQQTQTRRVAAMQSVAQIMLSIAEGEIVVREGQPVTAQQMLALGALGIATMWTAVFADVGVAVAAILNSLRILKIK